MDGWGRGTERGCARGRGHGPQLPLTVPAPVVATRLRAKAGVWPLALHGEEGPGFSQDVGLLTQHPHPALEYFAAPRARRCSTPPLDARRFRAGGSNYATTAATPSSLRELGNRGPLDRGSLTASRRHSSGYGAGTDTILSAGPDGPIAQVSTKTAELHPLRPPLLPLSATPEVAIATTEV